MSDIRKSDKKLSNEFPKWNVVRSRGIDGVVVAAATALGRRSASPVRAERVGFDDLDNQSLKEIGCQNYLSLSRMQGLRLI